jgi:8-oxo-dGTP pyrophosphatase MutT (NUDIX family)
MLEERRYRLVVADGVVAVILKGNRILILKRCGFPNPRNPGAWTFISGGRDRKRYLDVAYHEIKEEAGIRKEQLTRLGKALKVCMFERRQKKRWYNYMFFFKTDADKIKLNFENTAYRWAALEELRREINYTNIFINERLILNKIKGYINERKRSER